MSESVKDARAKLFARARFRDYTTDHAVEPPARPFYQCVDDLVDAVRRETLAEVVSGAWTSSGDYLGASFAELRLVQIAKRIEAAAS